MIRFDIHHLFPAFLLNDKNGYAIAKAIEAGMKTMCAAAQDSLSIVNDVETMPEWRLDEVAWEYNCPYDNNAPVEVKRQWVRDASRLSFLYGTPEAVYQYMAVYFDEIKVEEAWEYDGEPFHFRVLFPGVWTAEKVAWANKAISTVKNVRSILDLYNFASQWALALYAGCAIYAEQSGTYSVAAISPDDATWYADELDNMLLDETGMILFVEGTT